MNNHRTFVNEMITIVYVAERKRGKRKTNINEYHVKNRKKKKKKINKSEPVIMIVNVKL